MDSLPFVPPGKSEERFNQREKQVQKQWIRCGPGPTCCEGEARRVPEHTGSWEGVWT